MHTDEHRRNRVDRNRWVKNLTRVWPAVFLFWAVLVIVAYYRVHKPIGWSQAESIAHVVAILFGWLATISLAHGIGRFFITEQSIESTRTRFALRIGGGLGLIGFGVLLLGAFRLYRSSVCWVILLAGQFFSLPMFVREFRSSLPEVSKKALHRLTILFTGVLLCLAFLRALAPPTAYDSLVYHLTGPKLYIREQTLHHNLDLPYLGFPQAGEMLFLWGMLLVGPQISQLLHLTFLLLSLALLWDQTEGLTPCLSLFSVVLLLVTPSALQIAGWAYVDWIPMFSGLAALSIVEVYWTRNGRAGPAEVGANRVDNMPLSCAALVAFFAALAFNAKYTAVGLSVGILLAFLHRSRSIRIFAIASGFFLGFISPYLIKNALLTQNPAYPFFFGGKYWDALRATWYSRFGSGLSIAQVLRAPWDMSIGGVEGGVVQGYPAYGATLGPLLLVLAPFIVLAMIPSRGGQWKSNVRIGVVMLTGYLFWLIQISSSSLLVQSRLLFPVLPLVVLLIVKGFDRLTEFGGLARSVSTVLKGLVVFILALNAFSQFLSFMQGATIPYLLGSISEERYLENELGQYYLAIEKINELADGARVRFLWEARSYHCSGDVLCQPDAILDRWWHTRRRIGEPSDIAAAWKAEGVSHVFLARPRMEAVREAGLDPFLEEDWRALDTFIEQNLRPLGLPSDLYALYELE
jgi:hypothetical protein